MREVGSPLVAAIKRHSLEDGPGIRTVVFLKGCAFRCSFCQNPETRDPRAEIGFSPASCIGCGRCVQACPRDAASTTAPERIDRDRCDRCARCAGACPSGSLHVIGRTHEPEALVAALLRDRPFWRHSGGGVTFSGGECLLYPRYLERVLRLLVAEGVHVTIQTGGGFDYDRCAARVWPYVRLVQFDVKLADPRAHRKHCGTDNGRILANLRRILAEPGLEVQPRVPLVPGVTDAPGNLEAIVELLVDAGADRITLLPYNPLCVRAGDRVGLPRPLHPERFLTWEEEGAARERVRRALGARRIRTAAPEGPAKGDLHPRLTVLGSTDRSRQGA